jgi:hypothetical protein
MNERDEMMSRPDERRSDFTPEEENGSGDERSGLGRLLEWARLRRDRTGPTPQDEPPAARDGALSYQPETPVEDDLPQIEGALRLLRRGLRETPELRAGIGYTIGLAMALTGGRLLIPILTQQIFDRGLTGPAGFSPAFVYSACGIAAGAVVLV